MGISNVVVTNHAPQELTPHFPTISTKSWWMLLAQEKECSAKILWPSRNGKLIRHCSALQRQKEILAEAVAMLKPGGQLIYSTCTFAPEENEAIIEWLVSAYPFSIEPIELENVSHGRHDWAPMNDIEKDDSVMASQKIKGKVILPQS